MIVVSPLLAATLWYFRHSIKPIHLNLMLGVAAAAMFSIVLLRDKPFLPEMAVLVLLLSSGMAAFGFVLMLIFSERKFTGAGRTLRMRSGQRDLGRSYVVPQVAAVLIAMNNPNTRLAPIALVVATVFAGLSWVHAQRRLHAIRSTPTAKIVSAAQGHAEFGGVARPLGEKPLSSPLRNMRCVWFRYRIEEKHGNKWRIIDSAVSEEPFLLDDGTGTCVVEPAHAQVDTKRSLSWREGNRRYLEEWILPGARLYVLGEFVSENPAALGRNARREVGELLGQWKQDKVELHRRFDADGDGEISLDEWQSAQREARAIIDAEHAHIHALPATNFLRAPARRGDFIISDKLEQGVTLKARRGALLRMAWFGVVLVGAMVTTATEVKRAPERNAKQKPGR